MKIFKFLTVAIVAMLGFTACDNDCDHKFNDVDHTKELTGTWTCLEAGYAEALLIAADGSVVSYGAANGEFWEGVNGTIKVKDDKATMIFEDGDDYSGHIDVVPGVSFTIVEKDGKHYTYLYCAEDLSEEIVGMWICNDGTTLVKDGMAIQTFDKNGKTFLTTGTSSLTGNPVVNGDVDYKVVGDLMFHLHPEEAVAEGVPAVLATRLMYVPNGNALGDMMYLRIYLHTNGKLEETTSSWLRVKQDLDLTGNKYEYNNIYVSDVKGLDKEMEFMGFKLNFAEADGANIDKALKALLFNAEFPNDDTIKYSCRHSGNNVVTVEAPIVVDGNKMTVKVSEVYAGLKDVDLYCFQDADNCQLHMYMPTYSFVNFFGNMQIMMMSQTEQFDVTDAAAVKAVYDSVDNAVESINISFIMKVAK